jgi:hypothetical protein
VLRQRLVASVLALSALAVTSACSDGGSDDLSAVEDGGGARRSTSGGEPIGAVAEGVEGVEAFRVDSHEHTEEPLDYDHSPPVGGEHFPVPATCGFYDDSDPPPDELVVHDLEHGAIWIAYDPAVDPAQITAISELVARQAKVVATPREGLATPIVVSAWARQLALDSVDDPRLGQFIDTYRNSANAPEPDAACQGVGEPAVPSPTA